MPKLVARMAETREAPTNRPVVSTDPHVTDPTLLKDNSELRSFKTSRFEYPEIRVFFRQHPKAHELPTRPGPLPLLVCVPGLGGSVAQFHPLLSSLVDLAPCLSIDFPGGGRSRFAPKDWEAYTTEALTELLETVIESYRDKDAGQTVVLIGHSMGSVLSAWLANERVKHTTSLAQYVIGLVAICPVSGPPDETKTTWGRRLLWLPGIIMDLWRAWDGMGGPESPSVARFVGEGADTELKVLQHRFNKQSRTPVWRRVAYGALPVYTDGKPVGGLPGLDVWAGLEIPVYLIAGEKDNVTPPKEMDKIMKAMKGDENVSSQDASGQSHDAVIDAAAPVNTSAKPQDHIPRGIEDIKDEDFQNKKTSATDAPEEDAHGDPSTPLESPAAIPSQPRHPQKVVQSIIMPAPATHALLYAPRSARALAGLVSDFLATKITGRLSLAWQLQYLSREGKWDVKNLAKWKSVAPVSDLIGPPGEPIFRAMKTLREADDVHTPAAFVDAWGGVIKDVIDISKDQPVYDPRGLERAGVHYHKFPTVSKVPPHAEEVDAFIKLVDELRAHRDDRAKKEGWEDVKSCVIGVHCHYGFNRTGYYIVCYLVERCGFGVEEAVQTFAKARPNGIRHSHFLDRLYVRYNLEAPRET